jgi:dolichyl-phosphate beta-glucosyltransferase
MIFLSIVIPVYNEEQNLKRGVLKEVYDYLKAQKYSWEVIVSDDGSTDNSKELIKKQIKNLRGFRILENPHGGKPSALLYGIQSAKGEYTLLTDMDQSTPVSEVSKLLEKVKTGSKVVIGSRGLARENFPVYRRLGSVVFATFRRTLILHDIADTQCGFKLFESTALKKAFPKLEFFKLKEKVVGWRVTSYDVELLHILEKMGYKISEVTVSWNDKDVSNSKGGGLQKYIKESKEMFGQILRVRKNDILGKYDV